MKTSVLAAACSACFAASVAQAAPSIQGTELSIWGQRVHSSGSSTDIPYAFDQNTSQVIRGDLGTGNAYGIDLRLNLTDDWFATLGLADSKVSPNNQVFDSRPAATNDCNVRPVQGIVSDCFDNAHYRSTTKYQTLDAALGRRFAWGNVTVEPFAGVRYLRYSQSIHVDYLFPGGFEDFIDRNNHLSGWGPLLGLQFSMPLGQSAFFLRGGMSMASINFGGTRNETVHDFRTHASAPLLTRDASEDREVNPYAIDASLMLGYNMTSNAALGLGYHYAKVTGIVDTRDSNSPTSGIVGSRGLGVPDADLVTNGWFARLAFRF